MFINSNLDGKNPVSRMCELPAMITDVTEKESHRLSYNEAFVY